MTRGALELVFASRAPLRTGTPLHWLLLSDYDQELLS
jgi:hypothetical protein